MKEFLILVLLIFAACVFFACKQKKKEMAKKELDVEQCVLSDKEYMIENFGIDYKWYETSINLKDYLDEDGGAVESVVSVFQVAKEEGKSLDTQVVVISHTEEEDKVDVMHTFWVEDFPLEAIKITYQEALEIVNRVNLPKPHSKRCVLRKQVGPKPCNPQYIFGNQMAQIYVDAVTGDVTDKNPAFNE